MRALLLPSLACLSLILSGCSAVNSAHPLYTSEDAVQEPALVGTWISDDKDMPEFVFQKSDGNAYNMVLTDEESKTVYLYEVHLVRLEDQTFMDIVFRKQTVNGTEAGEALGVIPHHVIAKVEITENDLAYAVMDSDAVEKQNATGYLPFEFVKDGDTMLITSPTEVMREYFSTHSGLVFSDFEHLTRKAE